MSSSPSGRAIGLRRIGGALLGPHAPEQTRRAGGGRCQGRFAETWHDHGEPGIRSTHELSRIQVTPRPRKFPPPSNPGATNPARQSYPPRVIVSFSLDDLKQSIPGSADLANLSGDDLVSALGRMLGCAAEGAAIHVDGRMVILDFGEIPEERLLEAERLCGRAATRAAKGELPKAASIYRRVVELNPSHDAARRALAMVLMESGKPDEAVDVLLDVLKIRPRDPKALVILGNHYARQEGQGEVALRMIRRACDVAPDDAIARNCLGGLLLEHGRTAEAVAEFNTAIGIDPKLANAWYGRSMAEIDLRQWSAARDSLRQMFTLGSLDDRRQGRMLVEARDNYLRITNIIANDRAGESLKAVENIADRVADETGFAVTVREVPLQGMACASTHPAWTTLRDHHLIELQEKLPAEMIKHHVICHECGHLLLVGQARAAGISRLFNTADNGLAAAMEAVKPEIRRIAGKDYDEAKLADVISGVAGNSIRLLFEVPMDILIERRLAEVPELREARFCSLSLQVHNAAQAGLNSKSRDLIPPRLLRLKDVLNGASAVFLDRLSGGATDYSALYAKTGLLPLSRKIEELASAHDGPPGSEYDLIDRIADLLGVRDWYEWKPDPAEDNHP